MTSLPPNAPPLKTFQYADPLNGNRNLNDVEIQIDDVTALETTNVGSVCRSFVPLC